MAITGSAGRHLRHLSSILALTLLAACGDGTLTGTDHQSFDDDALAATETTGGWVVVLEEGASPVEVARDHGLAPGRTFDRATRGFAGALSRRAQQDLATDPRVRWIERDLPTRGAGSATQTSAPWGLDRVDQRETALDGSYTYPATGAGVTVYVLDSGIRTSHDDFGGRASIGHDVFDGDGSDCWGHGTHVAGTIGGKSYGVAKGVRLIGVKVLDCSGSGSVSGAVAGLEWVLEHASGPSVVNMSMAASGGSRTFDHAVQQVVDAGIPVVVAAMNDGTDACDRSPGRVDDALTIAATNKSDERPSWSNYGSCVDWFAPGASIVSADNDSDNGSATWSGTSMAAPHTAGSVALYLEDNPGASAAQVADALSSRTTKDAVKNARSANDHLLYVSGGGGGSSEPAPEPNEAPTADFTAACAELTCDVDGGGSSDADGSITSWEWDFGDGATATGATASHAYASGGSYTVTLTVTDDDGATAQHAAEVTVSEPTSEPSSPTSEPTSEPDPVLHVGDLDGRRVWKGKSTNWVARVTVRVRDGDHAGYAGATVVGEWGGVFSGRVEGTVDANGNVLFESKNTNRSKSGTFTVIEVRADGATWDEGAAHDPDGDSDGHSISITPYFEIGS